MAGKMIGHRSIGNPMEDGVLSVSVPAGEQDVAEAAMPGRVVASALADVPPHVMASVELLSLAYHDHLTAAHLVAMPRLRAVVTRSCGHDHLPPRLLRPVGVDAYHLGDYATVAVAEHAVMLILCGLRHVPQAAARIKERGWDRTGLVGRGLDEVTVGVLGTGRIGAATVRRLVGMGATVVGYDIEPDARLHGLDGFRYARGLDEMLQASDVLSVHVPLTVDTAGLVDARRLALLRPGAVLVNTARGEVVDPSAVIEALDARALTAYAADVLPEEPDPPDVERLRGRPDVLLTPHTAAQTAGTNARRYGRTGDILRALLEGRPETVAAHRVS